MRWVLLLLLVGCARPVFLPSVEPLESSNTTAPLVVTNTTPIMDSVDNDTVSSVADMMQQVLANITQPNTTATPLPPEKHRPALPSIAIPEGEVLPGFDYQYPREGTKVKGELVSVSLIMYNFTIGGQNQKPTWGEGYFRIWLNNATTPIIMERASKTLRGLPSGDVTMTVEMVMNNGSTYGVQKTIHFKAQTITAKN